MSSEKILRGVGTGGHGGAPIFRSNNPILTKRRTIYAHNLNTRPSPRALPDITSGPEVWNFFKILTVRKPNVFLHGHQTFKTFKIEKIKIIKKKKSNFFLYFFSFVYLLKEKKFQ